MFPSSILSVMFVQHLSIATCGSFTVCAFPMEQIEGGPIVAKMILVNSGTKPLWVLRWQEDELSVGKVDDKKIEPPLVHVGGRQSGPDYVRLAAGEKLADQLYIHHFVNDLATGRHALQLSWKVYHQLEEPMPKRREDDWTEGMKFSDVLVRMRLDIRRWDRKVSGELIERLNKQLNDKQLTDEQIRHVYNCVIESKHAELAPVSCALLKHPLNDLYLSVGYMVGSYCKIQPNPEAYVNDVIDALIHGNGWNVNNVFGYWKHFRTAAFNEKHFERILASNNRVMHLYLYYDFRDRLSKEQKAKALASIAAFKEAESEAVVKDLIDRLDAPSFQEREKAEKSLLKLGDVVLKYLQSHKGSSVEAATRIERIIAEIEKTSPSEFDQGLIRDLASESQRNFGMNPEIGRAISREIIDALATGPPSVWLTQNAKRIKENQYKNR